MHADSDMRSINKKMTDFFDTEGMGVCIPIDNTVEEDSYDGSNVTIHQRELKMIRNGLHYNEEGKFWTSEYPWIRDPVELPNNFPAAFGRLKSLERRLMRTGGNSLGEYDTSIKDMVERNVADKISNSELTSYHGPVHYIPHFEVINLIPYQLTEE